MIESGQESPRTREDQRNVLQALRKRALSLWRRSRSMASVAGTPENLYLAACGGTVPVVLRIETQDRLEPYTVTVTSPSIIVGRDSRADVVLDHWQISQRHAYIQIILGHLFCVDLDSRTGTHWHDGARPYGWLEPGRALRIGPYWIRCVAGCADAKPPEVTPLESAFTWQGLPAVTLELANRVDRQPPWPMKRVLTLVGRAAYCKVQLLGPSVSRYHCSLVRTPYGVLAMDLLGRGGIAVNRSRVRCAILNDGDRVEIGRFVICIHYESSPLPVPQPTSTATAERAVQHQDCSSAGAVPNDVTPASIADGSETTGTQNPSESELDLPPLPVQPAPVQSRESGGPQAAISSIETNDSAQPIVASAPTLPGAEPLHADAEVPSSSLPSERAGPCDPVGVTQEQSSSERQDRDDGSGKAAPDVIRADRLTASTDVSSDLATGCTQAEAAAMTEAAEANEASAECVHPKSESDRQQEPVPPVLPDADLLLLADASADGCRPVRSAPSAPTTALSSPAEPLAQELALPDEVALADEASPAGGGFVGPPSPFRELAIAPASTRVPVEEVELKTETEPPGLLPEHVRLMEEPVVGRLPQTAPVAPATNRSLAHDPAHMPISDVPVPDVPLDEVSPGRNPQVPAAPASSLVPTQVSLDLRDDVPCQTVESDASAPTVTVAPNGGTQTSESASSAGTLVVMPTARLPDRQEVLDQIVMPLVQQFSSMQQQMFDQFQQALVMVVQMFGQLHREQMASIRQELERLCELNRELSALQMRLAEHEAQVRSRQEQPTRRKRKRRDRTAPAQAAAAAPDIPSAAPRQSQTTGVPPVTHGLGPTAPQAEPETIVAASGELGQLASVVGTPAAEASGTPSAASTEPGQPASSVQAAAALDASDRSAGQQTTQETPQRTVQSDEDIHAWLSQRIAALQQERQSRWQKILQIFAGKHT